MPTNNTNGNVSTMGQVGKQSKKADAEKLLVCNCQRSMEIDKALGRQLGREGELPVQRELCRSQIGAFETALAAGVPVHVACTQEAALFREVAQEKGADVSLRFTNIREKAGWCEAKTQAMPKMAALLAESAYEVPPAPVMTLSSEGICLVYGEGQVALEVARELSRRLSVTLLFSDAGDAIPPSAVGMSIAKGRIRQARGHLGAFEIEVDGYAPMLPSSRAAFEFVMPRDGAKSRCDLILDISGGRPLFSDPKRRDGYVHADPRNPAAVAKAMFEISDLVGEFEKPLYVSFDAGLCAHARSQKVGCTNCLDRCPTGAITPAGDVVSVDPAICGGCGTCAAVCPTGAAAYAFPASAHVIGRAQVLLETYLAAGGRRPIVLFHDEKHGDPLISVMARLGRGLPPNVLPLSLFSVTQLGHDIFAAVLAAGAEQIVVLASPERPEEIAPVEAQAALARAFLDALGYAGPRVTILTEADPDAVETCLYELPALPAMRAHSYGTKGSKRDIARTVLTKLNEAAPRPGEIVALPAGAPYGRINIDVSGCTLCLSCVGACPANALADNPDRPEVAFTEAACVQCGVCVATCPEHVITLEPRYNFTSSALTPVVLKGEEPFHCVKCGKPFGTKASIERVAARLKDHPMFRGQTGLSVIEMCDNCRVVTIAESSEDPFRAGDRPRIRTTEDYLAAEAEAKKTGKKPEDFLT